MKNQEYLLTCIAVIVAISANADIVYKAKEYNPNGANYKARINLPYNSIYKASVKDDLLTLIYTKNKNQLTFKCFWISKSLEAKLPIVVVEYIGKYITDVKLKETNSAQAALDATKAAVNKALDQNWKNNLVTNAQTMVNNLRYHRGNAVQDNTQYYEFLPNHLSAPDSTKPDYIENPQTWVSGFRSGDVSRNNLNTLSTYISNYGEHHNTKVVSDWKWLYNEVSEKWELNSDTTNSHNKEIDTCKLKLELRLVNKGEKMPIMCWKQIYGAYWTKPPTYCNIFAQALAVRTFNKGSYNPQTDGGINTGWYPWGEHLLANEIYDYTVAHPELFVDLKWKDCWKYINAGYIVYFVWKNPTGGAGHIATGYPTSSTISINIGEKDYWVGNIAQAGVDGKTKIFQLMVGAPWSLKHLKDVKTFLYLGYLNF